MMHLRTKSGTQHAIKPAARSVQPENLLQCFEDWVRSALISVSKEDSEPERASAHHELQELAATIILAGESETNQIIERTSVYKAIEKVRKRFPDKCDPEDPRRFPEALYRMSSLTESSLRVYNAARIIRSKADLMLQEDFARLTGAVLKSGSVEAWKNLRMIAEIIVRIAGRNGSPSPRDLTRAEIMEAARDMMRDITYRKPILIEYMADQGRKMAEIRVLATSYVVPSRYVLNAGTTIKSDNGVRDKRHRMSSEGAATANTSLEA